MAYGRIQFLGLEYKLPMNGVAADAPGRMHYAGTGDDNADLRQQCTELGTAIQHAAISNAIDQRNDVLKVFMAPEFYFRGKKGAYDVSDVSTIMKRMREFTSDPMFNDWLFVYGTAIGRIVKDEGEYLLGMMVDRGTEEVLNIAMVQRGGVNAEAADGAFLIYKEYVSHIDFIRAHDIETAAWHLGGPFSRRAEIDDREVFLKPTLGSRDTATEKASSNLREYNPTQNGMGGGSIFVCGGIRFALEVCLDHAKGRVKESINAGRDSKVQVHLIPSAGMDIMDTHVATVENGLIFNVDGLKPHVVLKRRGATNGGTFHTTRIAHQSILNHISNGPTNSKIYIFPTQGVPYAFSLWMQGMFD